MATSVALNPDAEYRHNSGAGMSAENLLAHFDRMFDRPEAVSRLRRFILDLAVRGKLVPQDPTNEPALELLNRIAVEKVRLVRAGEIRKAKAIPALTEENLPFKLPANWVWSQIAEIGVLSPRNESADDFQASFVPMPMIASDYGVASDHEVRQWKDIKKGYTHFAEGDVGLAKITPCFQNRKSTVFRNLTGGLGSGTTELHIVRPLFVNPDFILLFLKSPYFIETGVPKMTGTAGQKRVPTEYFANSPFPLPPLVEQHRIVAKVDEQMTLCDRLEAARAERETTRNRLAAASLARLNAPDPDAAVFRKDAAFALGNLTPLTTRADQTKPLRQTILNLAVRGKLVQQNPNDEPATDLIREIVTVGNRGPKSKRKGSLPGFDEAQNQQFPYGIPETWVWAPLGSITNSRDGERIPVSREERLRRPKIYDYYGASGAIDKIDGFLFDKPLLLIGEDGANLINRSTPIAFIARGKYWVNNHAHVLDGLSEDFLRFIELFINATDLRPYVTGTAQPKMNQSKMNSIPVALPPLAEQRRIVAKVHELMALCDRLEARLTAGLEVRGRLSESILHEALEMTTRV